MAEQPANQNSSRARELGIRSRFRATNAGATSFYPAMVLAIAFFTTTSGAFSPHISSIIPTGGQRGTELDVTFSGDRLADAEEVYCYEPGLEILKLETNAENKVVARLKISTNCELGEHHLRLRARSGLSELSTFWVDPFPTVAEKEPNNEPAKAQPVGMNSTVEGVITSEDFDCFKVDAAKGELLSAEVVGIRLGRTAFDPRLTLIGPDGKVLADVDDTCLALQDPFISMQAPETGTYIFQLRETTYGGSDKCHYRLHIGSFPRPSSVFPLGGEAGKKVQLAFYSAATGEFTNELTLPGNLADKFPVFAALNSLTAPAPNWIRISAFPNVLADGHNHERASAVPAEAALPVAVNGILSGTNQEDWFRFRAEKDVPVEVNAWARRLRSPVDTVIEVFDAQGKSLASNDDSAGPDSSLKFTPSETTNYFIKIHDSLHQGGRDYVYRVELTPAEPRLAIKIPEVARNDTQSRQFIAVPRGNRVATLVSAKRSNFSSPLRLDAGELPKGVRMQYEPVPAGVDSLPVVFEADADAAVGGGLRDFLALGTNHDQLITGHFRQDVELVPGPNNTVFYATSVDKFCLAVTREAPFKLWVVEPKVPLVQSGSMRLQIVAERQADFHEPIEVKMVWDPPGINSQSEATIPKDATNVFYQLNAAGNAQTRAWKIALLGRAKTDEGEVYVSTQLAELQVDTPYVAGKIETLWLSPGASGKLSVNLQQLKKFDGKAEIRLLGLPENVTAAAKEISSSDEEVVFDVNASSKCPTGSHKNLFCSVDVKSGGETIPHTIAQGGILRVVPPKKSPSPEAARAKQTAAATTRNHSHE